MYPPGMNRGPFHDQHPVDSDLSVDEGRTATPNEAWQTVRHVNPACP
jgi:hypothetical protein